MIVHYQTTEYLSKTPAAVQVTDQLYFIDFLSLLKNPTCIEKFLKAIAPFKLTKLVVDSNK